MYFLDKERLNVFCMAVILLFELIMEEISASSCWNHPMPAQESWSWAFLPSSLFSDVRLAA